MTKGKRIGYVRVSTTDQNPDRQLAGIELDKKFIDYSSGKNLHRPQLTALLDYVREDDIVIVHSMDRLARNVKELLGLIDHLNSKKVEVHFVHRDMKFTGSHDPISRLILTVIGAVAELEREQILERQRWGIQQAKEQGKYKGGKTKITPEKVLLLEQLMKTREPLGKIAGALSVSRQCLYRYMKKIQSKKEVDSINQDMK